MTTLKKKLNLPKKCISISNNRVNLSLVDQKLDEFIHKDLYDYFLPQNSEIPFGEILHQNNNLGELQLFLGIEDAEVFDELINDMWILYPSFRDNKTFSLGLKITNDNQPFEFSFDFNIKITEHLYNLSNIIDQEKLSLYILKKQENDLILYKVIHIKLLDQIKDFLADAILTFYKSGEFNNSRAYQIEVLDDYQHFRSLLVSVEQKFKILTNIPFKIKFQLSDNTIHLESEYHSLDVQKSKEMQFNIPRCIFVEGIPFFPSKYEIVRNDTVYYYNSSAPISNVIPIPNEKFLFDEGCKEVEYTINSQDLKKYESSFRKRTPSQIEVMGESAVKHLHLNSDKFTTTMPISNMQWHWCHLIAFSMLPTEQAQTSNNLVCGSDAFNGQMMNMEKAVKEFIHKHQMDLKLTITALTIPDTHIAKRLRYRIQCEETGRSHSEYYNAFTLSTADIVEKTVLFNNLETYLLPSHKG
ncbi:hypothetical protein OF830_23975 [Bacillus paramycoides]|uniref:hypothetical protein n=1 Tax=Bacillus paramycoides TaxID=2026194 RepID=UPI00224436F1|nr:hypothetical protein [Bacillus paramycoides]MCW9133894.1 hypothetical protein [Bacillus paramycoides]